MKTRSIGEILRQEREKHHLSIADLAHKSRIRKDYLIALEDNDFVSLPSATFVKGYIRTYGKIFGFDHRPLQAILRRDFKESAKGRLVPREFINPVLKKKFTWTPVTIAVLVLSGIFISFVGYVMVAWFNLQKPPQLEVFAPDNNQTVSAQVIVEGKTLPDAVVSINAQPVSLQVDGSFKTEVFLPREGINTITISSQDRRGKSTTVQRTVKVEY